MASSADLTAACPHCGSDVTLTVELALAPLVVDGKNTAIATAGIHGDAHFCPPDDGPVAPGE